MSEVGYIPKDVPVVIRCLVIRSNFLDSWTRHDKNFLKHKVVYESLFSIDTSLVYYVS